MQPSWRNPSLAWFMVGMEFAQNEGRGLKLIIDHTKAISGKAPTFDLLGDWFFLGIPAYVPLELEKETGTLVDSDFDIEIDLPAIQTEFSELKFILEAVEPGDPKLEKELGKVEYHLDALTLEANKKELAQSFNKLRRFLEKLGEAGSDYNKVLTAVENGVESAQKVGRRFNKFSRWLAIPQVPDISLGAEKK